MYLFVKMSDLKLGQAAFHKFILIHLIEKLFSYHYCLCCLDLSEVIICYLVCVLLLYK